MYHHQSQHQMLELFHFSSGRLNNLRQLYHLQILNIRPTAASSIDQLRANSRVWTVHWESTEVSGVMEPPTLLALISLFYSRVFTSLRKNGGVIQNPFTIDRKTTSHQRLTDVPPGKVAKMWVLNRAGASSRSVGNCSGLALSSKVN